MLATRASDLTSLNNIYVNFKRIEQLLPIETLPSFKRWSAIQLDQTMSMVKRVDEKDVDAIIQLLQMTTPEIYFQK
jgi:hypothetical protein